MKPLPALLPSGGGISDLVWAPNREGMFKARATSEASTAKEIVARIIIRFFPQREITRATQG